MTRPITFRSGKTREFRPRCLRVWKLNEARTLAAKRADELKAEAAANPAKPLNELPSVKKENIEVLRTLPFSFLNEMFGRLQLGRVSGLQEPGTPGGPDFKQREYTLEKIGVPFMEKVFVLAPNQVDVAMNLPKTEFYVVRPLKFTPFNELWSDFIDDGDDWTLYTHAQPTEGTDPLAGLRQMCISQQSEVSQVWLQKVQEDAGLKWEKPPDQDAASGQARAAAALRGRRRLAVRNPAAARSCGCPTSKAHARRGLSPSSLRPTVWPSRISASRERR